MKIAASDFDGTLYTEAGGVPKECIAAIRRWQAAGNRFGIATGRSLGLIAYSLEAFGIRADFFVCNNGAVICDGERHILRSTAIPADVLRPLLALPLLRDPALPLVLFTATEDFCIRPSGDVPTRLLRPLALEDAARLDGVVQISMKLPDVPATHAALDRIREDFPALAGNINRTYLDLNMQGVDKGEGLRQLLEARGWDRHSLLVIGDDKNDLPMIRAFDGFTVRRAQPFMHAAATRVYDSVGQMLDEALA